MADIHFDAQIAIEAARRGAAKLRINPGNIGGWEKTDAVIEAAREAGIPIRIGVNAGSLDEALKARADLTLPEKLAASVVEYVAHFEERGFHDVVASAKAHDVMTTVATYRILAREIPQVPLHIGVTEAGTLLQGVVKSASGLGILLEEGIGDTMRISLTDEPTAEVRACWMLLSALDLRRRGPEIDQLPHVRTLPGGPDRSGQARRRAPERQHRADQSGRHGLRGQRSGRSRRRRPGRGLRRRFGRHFRQGKSLAQGR